MPSASAAGGATPPLPPGIEPDRREYLAALNDVIGSRPEGDRVRAWLESPRAQGLWDRYVALVARHSERLAIVGRGDRARLYTRHLLDSRNPLPFFDAEPGSLLDVGSGGGFPGIPLGIAWPGSSVTLLESRERKVGFLELVVRELALPNVRAVCARLEDRGTRWREPQPFEAVTIRAVGDLPSLLMGVRDALAPGARWVYFVGSSDRVEMLGDVLRRAGFKSAVRQGLFGGVFLVGRAPTS